MPVNSTLPRYTGKISQMMRRGEFEINSINLEPVLRLSEIANERGFVTYVVPHADGYGWTIRGRRTTYW
jgi:hypothetical protein